MTARDETAKPGAEADRLDAIARGFDQRRRWTVPAFWLAVTVPQAVVRSLSEITEHGRDGDPVRVWEPFVWEFSSLAAILALLPVMAALHGRFRLFDPAWGRTLAVHAAASVVFSIIHVAAMVGMRKVAYAAAGGTYEFGPIGREFLYEFRKDALTYLLVIIILEAGALWAAHLREAAARAAGDQRIRLPLGRGEAWLNPDEIAYVRAAGNYVEVVAGGPARLVRSTLTAMEARLPPERFVRVHRSHIVNQARVTRVEPTGAGDYRLVLDSGEDVPMSRRYRDRLSARID